MIIVNHKTIVKDLQKHYSDATEVVVVNNKGKVLYSSSKWNISKDIKGVLASWGSGNAQSVNMNGIRYSVLQISPEGFLEWIKNPQSLSSYLFHSLQENDPYRISKLTDIYNELYRNFYS